MFFLQNDVVRIDPVLGLAPVTGPPVEYEGSRTCTHFWTHQGNTHAHRHTRRHMHTQIHTSYYGMSSLIVRVKGCPRLSEVNVFPLVTPYREKFVFNNRDIDLF